MSNQQEFADDAGFWETEIYGRGLHLNRYPFDSVVSFVYKYAKRTSKREDIRILEVGCGAGNNLWFAAREGFQVVGLDGSQSALAFARQRFSDEKLNGRFVLGDYCELPFDDNQFDLIIDRCSLTCCGQLSAKKAVGEIFRVARNGAYFFMNSYSEAHESRLDAISIGDGLYSAISRGTLTGVGSICFYNRAQLVRLFEQGYRVAEMKHVKWALEGACKESSLHAEWQVILEVVK